MKMIIKILLLNSMHLFRMTVFFPLLEVLYIFVLHNENFLQGTWNGSHGLINL